MVTVRIPSIGEVLLDINTLIYIDGFYYISGYDDRKNYYTLKCPFMSWQNDLTREYGCARVIEYITCGTSVVCNFFTSIG